MKYLPIFYDLSVRPCLVVGAGDIAARKVRQLRKAEATVIVIAPDICDELKSLVDNNEIQYIAKRFSKEYLDDKMLVIAATNDQEVNKQVSELAQAKNIPVNVVDNPDLCSFIMPSIIDRDPVQIAISTGGASPVLARLLRARLETLIPASYGRLAQLMGKFREHVRQRYPHMQERRRFWENILQSPVAEMIYAGQDKSALAALEKTLLEENPVIDKTGEVYLVGAGPGDPDLLTFRALRLMQQAEVVLYDRLVAPEIIDLCRKDAERIYVGKKRDQHTLPQTEINQLLVDLAKQGKRVLRLKGGDPFIFGRGGEEIELLSAENISFQVVPGITAASGCASYAGIPLTHRDYAHSCVFITGHLKDGSMDLNWETLIQPKQTIAVYMGVVGFEVLCRELIERGVSETMPAALVQQGTTQKQKVYIGNLASLPEILKQHDIQPPTMIIIGEVVKCHEKLSWFEPQNNS
ncbi:MAG: uroporphyrin-III C-methyltransferase/precorrin-2 dehydrogenase/sirohydrochlorin ferrochelatase [Gammaproteobacteria bacterium]|jgi:uroporphyrin-III C-methyltransferase/precorrin-2 dehydrogenase/sirohydrochlorin ferrochelatase